MNSRHLFNCVQCAGHACEVEAIYRMDKPMVGDFLVHCHGADARVYIPMQAFDLASQYRGEMYFVVGFEGEWTVKLRHFPTVCGAFADPALGRFTQDQLHQLFGTAPSGLPMRPMNYGLRSQYYDIVHEPTGVLFPAEFWYKARYESDVRV
jgi:hypothetical protein